MVENDKNNEVRLLRMDDEELSSDGRKFLSFLEITQSELPLYANAAIKEALDDVATKFLKKVRKSVGDLFCARDIPDEERGLTKTFVEDGWKKEEKRYERVIQLFPDLLLEKREGRYPIQDIVLRDENGLYDLKLLSLLPLFVRLGTKFNVFEENLRGGLLLNESSKEMNVMQCIVGYIRKNNKNKKSLDELFFALWKWLRVNNYMKKDDIQQFNLVSKLCCYESSDKNYVEPNFRFFVDWDPTLLTVPCRSERCNFLPIHFASTNRATNGHFYMFSSIFKIGMQYFPEKFGFVFAERTHKKKNGRIIRKTPFQMACKNFGKKKVMDEIMNRYAEYCNITSDTNPTGISTSISMSNIRTYRLLVSAVTDNTKSIHLDGLYILIRNDPIAALLILQQRYAFRSTGTGNTDIISKQSIDNDDDDDDNSTVDTIDNRACQPARLSASASSSSSKSKNIAIIIDTATSTSKSTLYSLEPIISSSVALTTRSSSSSSASFASSPVKSNNNGSSNYEDSNDTKQSSNNKKKRKYDRVT